jgi:soluble lytic murein transglycosylase
MGHQKFWLLTIYFVVGCSTQQQNNSSLSRPQVSADFNAPVEVAAAPAQPSIDGVVVPPAESPALEEAPPTPEKQPNGQTSLSISVGQVSKDLGISKERLRTQTFQLAKFLDGNRLPRAYCEDNESTEKLCDLVDLVENNRTRSSTRHYDQGFRVPVRPHHFAAQQRMGYERLMRSLAREPASRILVWVPRMLSIQSCPRNLSAATIRRLESGLPNAQYAGAIEKLYAHAAACLKPTDEGYETTHLRQGLLRVLWGNPATARVALERAALAEESTDRTRVLYWAGALQKSPQARKRYWDRLTTEYPLSFHALEVWRHRGTDPMKDFETRPNLGFSRQVEDRDVDNALRWLESLYVHGHTGQAQKLARWMMKTFKQELPASAAFYISALKSSRATPLNTITFLTQQVAENPKLINRQTLRMLFPRAYWDVFDKHSEGTDTHLVLAVARQESGFNPSARSSANARGLLQILPSTARMLGGGTFTNLYDSDTNARLGVKYLSSLIDKFHSVEQALAGYNAGPGRVPDWKARYATDDTTLWMDLIPFKETRHYVANIVRNNYWYERIYGSNKANDPRSRELASSAPRVRRSTIVAKLVNAHASPPKKGDL